MISFAHKAKLALLVLSLLNGSCSDEENRPELVDKLKAIGVKANPAISTGSSPSESKKVRLTVYVLLLKEQTISSVTAFKDDSSKFSIPLDPSLGELTILTETASYSDFGPLKLYSIEAEALVPQAALIPFKAYNGVAKIRYGIQIIDSLGEREDIVGDFLLLEEGDENLAWNDSTPSIAFVKPEKDSGFSPGTDLDIQVKITKPRDEVIKVGWFVSSGKVKNFRDNTTVWEEPGSGEQALFVTVYAPKSKFFDFVQKKITFNNQ